jgi:hypothetical protein
LRTADFNRDGKEDFIIFNSGMDADPFPGAKNQIYFSGNDEFELQDDAPNQVGFSHGGDVSDINLDGWPDILFQENGGQAEPTLLLNNGDGTFTDEKARLPKEYADENWKFEPYYGLNGEWVNQGDGQHGTKFLAAEFGDFNGDEYPDLIASGRQEYQMGPKDFFPRIYINSKGRFDIDPQRILLGEGLFAFEETVNSAVAGMDLDGDGYDEALVSNQNTGAEGSAYQSFQTQVFKTSNGTDFNDVTDSTFYHLANTSYPSVYEYNFLDFNSDGYWDIAPDYSVMVANATNAPLVWLNDGTGKFYGVDNSIFGLVHSQGSFFETETGWSRIGMSVTETVDNEDITSKAVKVELVLSQPNAPIYKNKTAYFENIQEYFSPEYYTSVNLISGPELEIYNGSAEQHYKEIGANHGYRFAPNVGSERDDNVFGSSLDNCLIGLDGDDQIRTNGGRDIVEGGAGNDTILLSDPTFWSAGYVAQNVGSVNNHGTNTSVNVEGFAKYTVHIDGGSGIDTVKLTNLDDALFLDDIFSDANTSIFLTNSPNNLSENSRLHAVEHFHLGDGDGILDLTSDTAIFDVSCTVVGGQGNDIIWTSSGNDVLNGGIGNDQLFGGVGSDILTGGEGADVFEFVSVGTEEIDVIADFSHADGDMLKFFLKDGEQSLNNSNVHSNNTIQWGNLNIQFENILITDINDFNIQYEILL